MASRNCGKPCPFHLRNIVFGLADNPGQPPLPGDCWIVPVQDALDYMSDRFHHIFQYMFAQSEKKDQDFFEVAADMLEEYGQWLFDELVSLSVGQQTIMFKLYPLPPGACCNCIGVGDWCVTEVYNLQTTSRCPALHVSCPTIERRIRTILHRPLPSVCKSN